MTSIFVWETKLKKKLHVAHIDVDSVNIEQVESEANLRGLTNIFPGNLVSLVWNFAFGA